MPSTKSILTVCFSVMLALALLSGILGYQSKDLRAANEKLTTDFDALNKEYGNLQDSYSSLEASYSSLQTSYSSLQRDYTTLNESYHRARQEISVLQRDYASLQILYSGLSGSYSSLQANYTALEVRCGQAQQDISRLESQVSSLQDQLRTLQTSYQTLQTQYTTLQTRCSATVQTLYIGTALETYYDYVRANYYTFDLTPMGEERWWTLPDYYNVSVHFAADLACHDVGNCYWITLETGSGYYDWAGEYSYETSRRIMNQAIALANIYTSDSSVTKIEKVLAFINSLVHYEHKMLDHMWFPCETLSFRSGDCTGFSILAASMFEAAGIKSAVAFFTNSTMPYGHAMVLVRLDDLGPYGYWYYSDLTSYGLASGKWIKIEPQDASLSQQIDAWVGYWGLVACAEVPYGA